MIPEGHHRPAVKDLGNDVSHAHGEGRRTACAGENRAFTHIAGNTAQHFWRDDKAPAVNHLRGAFNRGANQRGR